jgi:hypothetical protein
MNISKTRSYTNLVLGDNGEEDLAVLIEPMRYALALMLVVFGGGVAKILLTLNGFLPGERADNVWDWISVGFGSVVSIACILCLVFIKRMALRFIVRYRMSHWLSD